MMCTPPRLRPEGSRLGSREAALQARPRVFPGGLQMRSPPTIMNQDKTPSTTEPPLPRGPAPRGAGVDSAGWEAERRGARRMRGVPPFPSAV